MAKRKDVAPEPALPQVPDSVIDEMVLTYRRIRKAVYEEATKSLGHDGGDHALNKQTFRNFVVLLCRDAKLSTYSKSTAESRRSLWRHIWTKIRYARIDADSADKEIKDIVDIFDNVDAFCDKEWALYFNENRKSIGTTNRDLSGFMVRQYLDKNGPFSGKYYYRNMNKLYRTIKLAHEFTDYFLKNPDAPAIHFLSNSISSDNVWRIHKMITERKDYLGNITALHLMMDLGYEVMKPDRVMARAFFRLGWLAQVVDLPNGIREAHIIPSSSKKSPEAVEDEERPSSEYHYIHPNISRPIVDLSRQIAARVRKEDLKRDIGWCTNNKLREFDIFMVKYGQKPEKRYGLHRNLSTDKPYEAFLRPLAVG